MAAQGLNERQTRFVQEYAVDLNATQAAIRAGYSARTAEQQGSRLLSNVKVQKAVRQALQDASQRTAITQEMVLRELAAIAFADAGDYQEVAGDELVLRDSASIGREKRRAIQGYRRGKAGPEVQLCDRMKALELLAKHLGMFETTDTQSDSTLRVEIQGDDLSRWAE